MVMLTVTADQLVAHAVGDFLLQSDWMAEQKTRHVMPAFIHAALYTVPFVFVSRSLRALAIVGATHFVIDHWRLARYVCWATNQLAPLPWRSRLKAHQILTPLHRPA